MPPSVLLRIVFWLKLLQVCRSLPEYVIQPSKALIAFMGKVFNLPLEPVPDERAKTLSNRVPKIAMGS